MPSSVEYLNPWYGPNTTGPEYFKTDANPVLYRGFPIYRRYTNSFEIVHNDVCIGQYAGLSGAKKQIDRLIDEGDNIFLSRKAKEASGLKFPIIEDRV